MYYFIESIQQYCQVNTDSIPILEIRKLILREVNFSRVRKLESGSIEFESRQSSTSAHVIIQLNIASC